MRHHQSLLLQRSPRFYGLHCGFMDLITSIQGSFWFPRSLYVSCLRQVFTVSIFNPHHDSPLGSLSRIQSSAFLSSLKVDFLVQGIHSFTPVKGASRHLSQRPGFQFGHCGHEFSATFSVLHLPGSVVILASYSFSNFKGPSEYSSQTV
jgi:hypothetical protein